MKKLAAFALCLALAGCGPSAEWRELAVSDGGFSILMRGAPVYTPQQFDTPAGRISAHMYHSDRPDAYFAIGYVDYPLALVVSSGPETILAGPQQAWMKRIEGKVTSTQPLKLAGKHPGVQFTVEGRYKDRDALLEGRLYLVDQRLYQLIAISHKGELSQGVVNRYFDSFKLIPVTYTEHVKVKPPPAK